MKKIPITIGWTISDMPRYSSFGDGYQPGAKQHTETFEIEIDEGTTTEDIAWAALEATNSPYWPEGGLVGSITAGIGRVGYSGEGAHYSLSKGDTITALGKTVAYTGLAVEEVSLS